MDLKDLNKGLFNLTDVISQLIKDADNTDAKKEDKTKMINGLLLGLNYVESIASNLVLYLKANQFALFNDPENMLKQFNLVSDVTNLIREATQTQQTQQNQQTQTDIEELIRNTKTVNITKEDKQTIRVSFEGIRSIIEICIKGIRKCPDVDIQDMQKIESSKQTLIYIKSFLDSLEEIDIRKSISNLRDSMASLNNFSKSRFKKSINNLSYIVSSMQEVINILNNTAADLNMGINPADIENSVKNVVVIIGQLGNITNRLSEAIQNIQRGNSNPNQSIKQLKFVIKNTRKILNVLTDSIQDVHENISKLLQNKLTQDEIDQVSNIFDVYVQYIQRVSELSRQATGSGESLASVRNLFDNLNSIINQTSKINPIKISLANATFARLESIVSNLESMVSKLVDMGNLFLRLNASAPVIMAGLQTFKNITDMILKVLVFDAGTVLMMWLIPMQLTAMTMAIQGMIFMTFSLLAFSSMSNTMIRLFPRMLVALHMYSLYLDELSGIINKIADLRKLWRSFGIFEIGVKGKQNQLLDTIEMVAAIFKKIRWFIRIASRYSVVDSASAMLVLRMFNINLDLIQNIIIRLRDIRKLWKMWGVFEWGANKRQDKLLNTLDKLTDILWGMNTVFLTINQMSVYNALRARIILNIYSESLDSVSAIILKLSETRKIWKKFGVFEWGTNKSQRLMLDTLRFTSEMLYALYQMYTGVSRFGLRDAVRARIILRIYNKSLDSVSQMIYKISLMRNLWRKWGIFEWGVNKKQRRMLNTLDMVSGILRKVNEFLSQANEYNIIRSGAALVTLKMFGLALDSMQDIIIRVKDMRKLWKTWGIFEWGVKGKQNKMFDTIDLMKGLMGKINEFIQDTNKYGVMRSVKALLIIKAFSGCVGAVKGMVIKLLAMTGWLVLLIIASPILLLSLLIFRVILKLMFKIFEFSGRSLVHIVRAALQIILISLATDALIVLGLTLLVLGLISVPLIRMFPLILLTMLGIVAYIGVIILMGLLLTVASPAIIQFTVSMVYVFIATLSIVLIAAMLWILQNIVLDFKRIKQNIHLIMQTIWYMVDELYSNPYMPESDNMFVNILTKVANSALITIIAPFASITLVMAVISTVSILFIATALRLLQNLNLDRARIMNNVRTVLGTVGLINRMMNQGFQTPENNNGELASIDYIKNIPIISEIYTLFTAINASLSLVLTVVTVASMWLIAHMLKSLSNIKLDRGKIRSKVHTILGCVGYIYDSLLGDSWAEAKQGYSEMNMTPEEQADTAMMLGLGDVVLGILKVASTILNSVTMILTLISVGVVWLIAKMLESIQHIPLDRNKLHNKIRDIMGSVEYLMDSVLGDSWAEANNGTSDNIFINTIVGIFKPIGDVFIGILKTLSAVATTGILMMTIVCVAIVWMISKMLISIQSMEFRPADLKNKLATVMECVSLIMDFATMGGTFQRIGDRVTSGPLGQAAKGLRGDQDNGGSMSWYDPILNALGGAGQFVTGIFQFLKAAMAILNLVAMIFCVGMVYAISKMFKGIQDMKIDGNILKNTLNAIMTATNMIFSWSLGEGEFGSPAGNALAGALAGGAIGSVIPGVGTIIGALIGGAIGLAAGPAAKLFSIIEKISSLAAIYFTIGMVFNVAKNILAIYRMPNINKNVITSKVRNLFSIIKTIQQVITDNSSFGDAIKGWISANFTSGLGSFSKTINRLAEISNNMFNMYSQLRTVNVTAMGRKVVFLLGSIKEIQGAINRLAVVSNTGYNEVQRISRNLEQMQDIPSQLSELVAQITSTDNIDQELLNRSVDENINIVRKVDSIIQAVTGIKVNKRLLQDRLNTIGNIQDQLQKFTHITGTDVKNSKDLTDNYIKFINRLDKADLSRLKVMERTMAHWASLAHAINGNFEGLAKSLNEHIAPMLEKMNTTMDKVSEVQSRIMADLKQDTDQFNSVNGSTPDMGSSVMPGGSTPGTGGSAPAAGGGGSFGVSTPVGGNVSTGKPDARPLPSHGHRGKDLNSNDQGSTRSNPLFVKIVR